MLRGEIWYVDLSMENCGSEQSGLRPCVIIQNDIGNTFSPTTIICPITAKKKSYSTTHVMVNSTKKPSVVLVEQIRVVDKSKLKRRLGTLTKLEMEEVDLKLLLTLSLKKGWK